MVNVTEGLAVSVYEALVVVIVVLYSSSSWTFEGNSAVVVLHHEGTFVCIFFLDDKTLIFPLFHEILKILEMVLPFLVSPDIGEWCFLAIAVHLSIDEYILEDALGRDGDGGYFINRRIVVFHKSVNNRVNDNI